MPLKLPQGATASQCHCNQSSRLVMHALGPDGSWWLAMQCRGAGLMGVKHALLLATHYNISSAEPGLKTDSAMSST